MSFFAFLSKTHVVARLNYETKFLLLTSTIQIHL